MGRMTATNNIAQLFNSIAPGVAPEDVRIAEAMVFASAEPRGGIDDRGAPFGRRGCRGGDGGAAAAL